MPRDLLKKHPKLVLRPEAPIRDAMEAMTRYRIGIALVAGKDRRLLGVVADIDIRKALLHGCTLDAPVSRAMNRSPITVPAGLTDEEIAEAFRAHPKTHLPIVDGRGRLEGLASVLDYATIPPHYPNQVVIMAGGLGQRLRPLTHVTPKPMLPLGNKPILEVLLEQFKASGFAHFYFAVNHLADKITDHFGDGSRWGVKIEYLREPRPMGTVGALSLIRRRPQEPLLMANGDILTKVDFGALLDFHKAEGALATLCVKSHEIHIPYGVVEIDGYRLQAIKEKPIHRAFINAGIYVLEPQVLDWVSPRRRCDMPDLIASIRRRRKSGVACFPIQEYWLDIGEHQAYRKAAGDYTELFE